GVELLQRASGEHRSRADAVEQTLLGWTAGRVGAEDPAPPGVLVVAYEQGHRQQPLHRGAEVPPDHRRQPGRLAREGQWPAFQLLEVLKLHLKQPDQLHRDAPRAGHARRRVIVGAEYLADITLGDHAGHRRAPVPGDDHAVGVRGRDDRGAVLEFELALAAAGAGEVWQQFRGV